MSLLPGSGGGGGSASSANDGGEGGASGGLIWLQAEDAMTISGRIAMNGSDGTDGKSSANSNGGGGGGGGSGGGIGIKLDSQFNTLTITGELFAAGGTGGNGGNGQGILRNGGGGGGGGGGGRIKIFFNHTFTNSTTFSISGGSGGSGGTAFNSGSAGVTGSPGSFFVIPEYSAIAIPIALMFIVIIGLRRKSKNRKPVADRREVIA
jgi:hypothetical protein